jgi:hypothetical protein
VNKSGVAALSPAGLIWYVVARPCSRLSISTPELASHLIAFCTARSDKHVRLHIVPTAGQHTPWSFA